MKIQFNEKQMVVLMAETAQENAALFNLVNQKTAVRAEKKTRGSYGRRCEVCNVKFKNRIAIGVHKSMAHGIKSMAPAAVYAREKKMVKTITWNGTTPVATH